MTIPELIALIGRRKAYHKSESAAAEDTLGLLEQSVTMLHGQLSRMSDVLERTCTELIAVKQELADMKASSHTDDARGV